jgi:hypothetical protein
MYGSRDPKSRLWRVNLKQKMKPKILQCNHAHDNNNQKDVINYLHAACFSPVKSTWIKAIKNGIFSSWPGLNEQNIEKYLSKSTSTANGHLNQQRQNVRTTKIKDAELIDPEPDPDHGIKTQYVYAETIGAGQIYTDKTGRFPIVSSKGNKYIMVLYDYDSNAILAKPIKDGKAPELLNDKLLPLPQPPVRARTDARTNPSAQKATQLRRVLARVYAVSIQNQITTTVP